MVFTALEGMPEHSPGAVEYEIGSGGILIASTNQFESEISYQGRDYLRLLRDALIEICEIEKIE